MQEILPACRACLKEHAPGKNAADVQLKPVGFLTNGCALHPQAKPFRSYRLRHILATKPVRLMGTFLAFSH
jgi:hypothetical protein